MAAFRKESGHSFEIAEEVSLKSIGENPDKKALWQRRWRQSSESVAPLETEHLEIERLQTLDLGVHVVDFLAGGHGVALNPPCPITPLPLTPRSCSGSPRPRGVVQSRIRASATR